MNRIVKNLNRYTSSNDQTQQEWTPCFKESAKTINVVTKILEGILAVIPQLQVAKALKDGLNAEDKFIL